MKVVKSKVQLAKQEETLRKVFASNDEEKTVKAVKKLRENGHPELIVPLLDLLSSTENDTVFSTVVSLLNDLKDQDAAKPLIDALNDEKYEGIRIFILQTFWQSRLDALPYLDEIVNLAIKSDYMITLECLTIVESFKNAPTDEEIVEVNTQLKDAIMDDPENKDLLAGMIDELNNYMIG
jgi:hypothetical protein|tara:strand:- start:3310 stop:3849 length:540 start_codon:yes stop_codon:yes gene_type:complete